MVKWKLFSKSKLKNDEIIEIEETTKEPEEKIEKSEEIIETEKVLEDKKPLAEYHETLETGVSNSKKLKTAPPSDQRIWRDVDLIENKIDSLHITRAQKPVTEIDKKVDKIVSNVKLKKGEKNSKPSNVIYVVSNPQPGEVSGDWAVRSHGKFFSHHKSKEKAIEEARKIAKKRDATVRVQNTDGTFSEGFKPR
jgi:hypothetical protein